MPLSKSRVISGLQCEKQLYLVVQDRLREQEGKPKLAKYSATSQQAMKQGKQVGELARQLFPGGKLVEHDMELRLALEQTRSLLNNGLDVPLFEATFSHNDVLVRADIFVREPAGSRLIEVKSSSSAKEHHLDDCAIQAWVIENAGYPLSRIEVAHVDTSFVYQGDDNYDGLIKYEDVTKTVRERIPEVPNWIQIAREALANGMPEKLVGPHCRKPYECAFLEHCTPTTAYPITKLPRPDKSVYALLKEGILDIRNIPEGRLTKPEHERVRRVTLEGKPELDPGAAAYLQRLPYPRYYLDFETISFIIPVWAATRPYEALPFQWSCHIEQEDSELDHAEFLDRSGDPPMRLLAESLLAKLGESGPIFMYTNYEEGVIRGLANRFPDLAKRLEGLIERLVDLHPLTKDYYYHPDMKGSWSIKAVLPTIAPDLRYDALDGVQDGSAASLAYLELIDPATDKKRRDELIDALLEYCNLDTFALVRLARFLQQK